jgi:pantoate--beta-alanine ligase
VQIITSRADMRVALRGLRPPVALVPTMGALHTGHLALVDAARARAASVVMSVFVNPLQFAPTDDFAAYPRDLEKDARLARERGVDVLFAPTVNEMYPARPRVVLALVPVEGQPALDSRWEGAARPGHFGGVLTVVAKLFHLVQPHVAVFGRKDLQQVTLIRAMVRDLDMPVEIVAVPTVRSGDGLALSSRNAYLSESERERALVIPRALEEMLHAWATEGIVDADDLMAVGRRVLEREPTVAVEYLGVADPAALEPVTRVNPGTVAMIAAKVGRTRLIDNVVFERAVDASGTAPDVPKRARTGPRTPWPHDRE